MVRRLVSKVVSKLFSHRDPLVDREFANIYQALAKLDMGNFSWNYDQANNRLVLQVVDESTTRPRAVLQVTESGALESAGAGTYSSTLEDY
jgi:hypothetical protein